MISKILRMPKLSLLLCPLAILFIVYDDTSTVESKDLTGTLLGNVTDSDFFLVIENVTTNPAIATFSLGGNGYSNFCASQQCMIKNSTVNKFTYETQTEGTVPRIGYHLQFTMIDNNYTSNKFSTGNTASQVQFDAGMYACNVSDFKVDNNQEVYHCSGDLNSIERKPDGETWYYNSTGIYDAKMKIFTLAGNYTHSATFFADGLG